MFIAKNNPKSQFVFKTNQQLMLLTHKCVKNWKKKTLFNTELRAYFILHLYTTKKNNITTWPQTPYNVHDAHWVYFAENKPGTYFE